MDRNVAAVLAKKQMEQTTQNVINADAKIFAYYGLAKLELERSFNKDKDIISSPSFFELDAEDQETHLKRYFNAAKQLGIQTNTGLIGGILYQINDLESKEIQYTDSKKESYIVCNKDGIYSEICSSFEHEGYYLKDGEPATPTAITSLIIKRQIFVVGEDINEYFTVYDRYLKTTLSEFYEKIKPLCKSIVEKNPQLQLSADGTGFFRNDIYPFENLQNVQNLSTDLHIDQPEKLKMKTYADFIEPSKQLEQKCQIIYDRMINALLLSENIHR